MHQPDPVAEELAQGGIAFLRGSDIEDLGQGHQRAHPIDLRAAAKRPFQPAHHLIEALVGHGAGGDRLPPRRLLVEARSVHVAIAGEEERAGDGRGGHHQELGGASGALGLEREALMHAEAVLLVDHHEGKVTKRDSLLEQGMGADENIDLAFFQRGKDRLPLAAALAPGEQRDAQSRRGGKAFDRLEVLAGQDLGRRHERGLGARLDGRSHGEQRHHGLAAAHITLQQPQHAQGPREVGVDLGESPGLCAGEPEGELGQHGLAELPGGGEDAPRAATQALADGGQRQLVGEELIVSEPLPRRRSRLDIGGGLGRVHAPERLGKGWPGLLGAPAGVDPFGQGGQPRQSLRDDLAQHRIGEAGGQGVERLEQRQRPAAPVICFHHVIGVRHLQPAVIGFELARDDAPAAHGQEPLQIGAVGVEIDELERARSVLNQHAIGRPRTAPRAAGPVLGDGDFERGEVANASVGDFGCQLAVDDAHRQVPEEIDDSGMGHLVTWGNELVQQAFEFGPDACEAAGRGEEGGEEIWPHQDSRASLKALSRRGVVAPMRLTEASPPRSNALLPPVRG